MVQKEVAERIAASPGSKTYGILSVLIQAWYHVEYLFTVDEHVFNPPPKVKSAVIRMTRNDVNDLGCNEKLFKQIVKTTFNQRRKTLRNSIASILNKTNPLSAEPIFSKRPEQLSVQDFIGLTNWVEKSIRGMNNEELLKEVSELIEQKESDKLKEILHDLHPADIAELCNELDAEEARSVYLLLDNETAADVLIEMDEDARKRFLEILPSETIAKRFVDYMDSDDAVDIIREMDEDKQEEVLSHIEDIEQAGDIVDLLKYDEDTAGGLMGTEMVIVNENWSMPECLREMRIQAEEMDEIYYVYVVDDDERLRGVFPLKKMITSPSVSKVKHVMKKRSNICSCRYAD